MASRRSRTASSRTAGRTGSSWSPRGRPRSAAPRSAATPWTACSCGARPRSRTAASLQVQGEATITNSSVTANRTQRRHRNQEGRGVQGHLHHRRQRRLQRQQYRQQSTSRLLPGERGRHVPWAAGPPRAVQLTETLALNPHPTTPCCSPDSARRRACRWRRCP